MVVGTRSMRYAITDLSALAAGGGLRTAGDVLRAPEARRSRLLGDLRRWTAEGIRFVQLREKSLDAGEVFSLAQAAVGLLSAPSVRGLRPHLLVNGRPDIAAAARADGVHLTAVPGELTPGQAREVFKAANLPRCLVSVSCHSLHEVARAAEAGADLMLFGPVFEKKVDEQVVSSGQGIRALGEACAMAGPVSVFAVGGVTRADFDSCLRAGAAGVAGIRLFSRRDRFDSSGKSA